jgi:hypothetical protein
MRQRKVSELVPNRSEEKMGMRGGFFSNPLSDVATIPPPSPEVFEQRPNSSAPLQKIRCIFKKENSIHIQEAERGRSFGSP